MRQIKFRGRDVETGAFVYGSLVDHGESYGYRYWIYPIDGGRNYPVEPESVAQLMYVADKEYYEGDVLERDGRKWRGSLVMRWTEGIHD